MTISCFGYVRFGDKIIHIILYVYLRILFSQVAMSVLGPMLTVFQSLTPTSEGRPDLFIGGIMDTRV